MFIWSVTAPKTTSSSAPPANVTNTFWVNQAERSGTSCSPTGTVTATGV